MDLDLKTRWKAWMRIQQGWAWTCTVFPVQFMIAQETLLCQRILLNYQFMFHDEFEQESGSESAKNKKKNNNCHCTSTRVPLPTEIATMIQSYYVQTTYDFETYDRKKYLLVGGGGGGYHNATNSLTLWSDYTYTAIYLFRNCTLRLAAPTTRASIVCLQDMFISKRARIRRGCGDSYSCVSDDRRSSQHRNDLSITCYGNFINFGTIICNGSTGGDTASGHRAAMDGGDLTLKVFGFLDIMHGYLCVKGVRYYDVDRCWKKRDERPKRRCSSKCCCRGMQFIRTRMHFQAKSGTITIVMNDCNKFKMNVEKNKVKYGARELVWKTSAETDANHNNHNHNQNHSTSVGVFKYTTNIKLCYQYH